MSELTKAALEESTSLRGLNSHLTDLMARQRIQSLIKDDALLNQTLERISTLVVGEGSDGPLVAIAVLGRLAAVARGRDEEQKIVSLATALVSKEPPSLGVLADAEERAYAAQILQRVEAPWLLLYSARESVAIDTAENARRSLLEIVVSESQSIAEAMVVCSTAFRSLDGSLTGESRAKRARRVTSTIAEVYRSSRKIPGPLPGAALKEFASAVLPDSKSSVSEEVLFGIADDLLAILTRVIELRFSVALDAEIYNCLSICRMRLGRASWYRFVAQSSYAEQVKVSLSEAALVLARQGRSDRTIIDTMLVMYPDRSGLTKILKNHFTIDIEPGIKGWWLSGGTSASQTSSDSDRGINTSEDQRIGEALIEVEKIDPAIRYMSSTVKPELQFSNPPAAAALARIVASYRLLAQNIRQLAKLRKLGITHQEGQTIEYSSSQHEMLGGHQDGVRQVKVVREGIEKQYSNRQALLVKPWVEPAKD